MSCSLLLVAGACTGLTGCKQTDFLKKITINPDVGAEAETDPIVYNSPDAEEEADWLAAFDLVDDAPETAATENIVVPTLDESKANIDLPTRHSVFDLDHVKIKGLASTDGVRLVKSSAGKAVDEEIPDSDSKDSKSVSESDDDDAKDKEGDDEKGSEKDDKGAQSDDKGSKQSASEKKDRSGSSGASAGQAGSGGGAGSDENPGNGHSGDDNDDGSGDEGNQGESADPEGWGTSAAESGGYDGSIKTYNPGNKLDKPQECDHVAAIGQAAVLVQAMAGRNALVGIDDYTYEGKNDMGAKICASSFAAVFADDVADGFSKDCVLWENDGHSPADLSKKNTERLVEALTSDGSVGDIFYCASDGSYEDLFNKTQLEMFEEAGIAMVPVDLSTVDGTVQAAKAVGEALSTAYKKGKIAEDPQKNAADYKKALKGIVSSAKGSRISDTRVRGFVCNDFEAGVTINNEYKVNASGGMLFVRDNMSVLSEYLVASGLYHPWGKSKGSQPMYAGVLQFDLRDCTGYRPDGPFARYYGDGNNHMGGQPFIEMSNNDGVVGLQFNGLYSRYDPYLIVADASDGKKASSIKKTIVKLARSQNTLYTLWDGRDSTNRNTNGEQNGVPSQNVVKYGDMSLEDTLVRENPSGLLGEWSCNGVESIMEVMWLTLLYSKAPVCNDDYRPVRYQPINSANVAFDANGDGASESSLEGSVKAFYKRFYRYSFGDNDDGCGYEDVVTDDLSEGLE